MPRPSLAFVAAVAAAVAIGLTAKFYLSETGAPAGAFAFGGPATLAGAPAQSYEVKNLAGKADNLLAYRGHVVLLNLWASWCAPCRSETPALEKLYEQERGRGLVVIGVDQGDSNDAAAAFVNEMKLSYPIWIDEEERYGRAYAAVGLPTSLVIGTDGRIVRGIDGELSLADMHQLIDPLLRSHVR